MSASSGEDFLISIREQVKEAMVQAALMPAESIDDAASMAARKNPPRHFS